MTATEPSLLELDDIQHILLTRTPAVTGRYEFLSFDDPSGGRAWLTGLLDRVQSAADAQATMDASQRWITLAFTWNGLSKTQQAEIAAFAFVDRPGDMGCPGDRLDRVDDACKYLLGGLK